MARYIPPFVSPRLVRANDLRLHICALHAASGAEDDDVDGSPFVNIITLTVKTTTGKVATLFDDIAEAGRYYKITFDASSLASGMYMYRLQSGNRNELKKLLLLK